MIDLLIVCAYFLTIFLVAFSGRQKTEEGSVETYFLSNRNLRWYSVALSTIATNVQGYQFLGMMGSAYLYGLAQANLEINAMQGILMAAFIFVPLYLKDRIITITQFIKKQLGETIALCYSAANLLLFSTITLGAALFWGAYAADLVFAEYLSFISEVRIIRVSVILVGLGVFSATYTYLGGLNAVVKTDIIQFVILLTGGLAVLFITINKLGGWEELYNKTPELMHLHLAADHPKLPWTSVFALFFLNINYWCANQSVIQRSLAARSLRDAQVGLMFGGVMKYVMAAVIILPGIALFGILGENGLSEPDMAFPYIVKNYLPVGVKGIILCALFASLMSTVDSTFNSLATLWSVDMYKGYINKEATENEMVKAGKNTILVTLCTGVIMGLLILYIKFNNPEQSFTHTLNSMRYYVICGIVVIICTAVFLLSPSRRMTLVAIILTIPVQIGLTIWYREMYDAEMNYFNRALCAIAIGLLLVLLSSWQGGWRKNLIQYYSKQTLAIGIGLAVSLVVLHIVFH